MPPDPRLLMLAAPSAAILSLLVFHSFKALQPRRAGCFWASVVVYGILRGAAVRWITGTALAAPFPYVIHNPLLRVFGVSFQEVMGWAIVSYLGWWLGGRHSTRLFPQIAFGCLFLGAISWTVESAAVAAGWWHWTVPVSNPLFGNVPFIGVVDWFFVGTDFLFPFLLLSSTSFEGRPIRFLSLLLFPIHFASHAFLERAGAWVPIPLFHLVHWSLLVLVLWLALRSTSEDRAFERETRGFLSWLPLMGLTAILFDGIVVQLFIANEPRLLPSVVPAVAVALTALRPAWGLVLAALSLLLARWLPPLALSAIPAASSLALRWGRRQRLWLPVATVALLFVLAVSIHATSAHRTEELTRRLEIALRARDRGDLPSAEAELQSLCADFPASQAPFSFLGEIEYKTGRLVEARPRYATAIRIKQDFLDGYRHLAVIELRLGDPKNAADVARLGLRIRPEDLELSYLLLRAKGDEESEVFRRTEEAGPRAVEAVAALAFEVGDRDGANALLARGLSRWPAHVPFHRLRARFGQP